jgi:hypothetical protein
MGESLMEIPELRFSRIEVLTWMRCLEKSYLNRFYVDMEKQWFIESQRFSKLSEEQQVYWLAKLLFLLTIFARDCYAVGSDGVSAPEKLRRFNEIMHRISSHQLSVAESDKQRMGDDVLFEMIAMELELLNVDMEYIVEKLR